MNEPIVYIILPVYNGGEFFRQQLYTIVNQNYNNWNLVIINDGSTDHTMNIIEDFTFSYNIRNKITVISQENTGQYAACGVGLEFIRKKMKGNYKDVYISYCDADDLRTNDKLKIQVEYMQTHPGCDMSYHDCWLINGENEIIGESSILYFAGLFSAIDPSDFFDISLGHNIISTEMMFRGGFIDEILPIPDFMSQDRWVSLCISAVNGQFGKLDRKLGYYRIHNNSSLHKKKNIDFFTRQYDTFLFMKNTQSYGGKRGQNKNIDYFIKYWKQKRDLKKRNKCIIIKILWLVLKFPRIPFLLIKNLFKQLKFRFLLYKKGFLNRVSLHHSKGLC